VDELPRGLPEPDELPAATGCLLPELSDFFSAVEDFFSAVLADFGLSDFVLSDVEVPEALLPDFFFWSARLSVR